MEKISGHKSVDWHGSEELAEDANLGEGDNASSPLSCMFRSPCLTCSTLEPTRFHNKFQLLCGKHLVSIHVFAPSFYG